MNFEDKNFEVIRNLAKQVTFMTSTYSTDIANKLLRFEPIKDKNEQKRWVIARKQVLLSCQLMTQIYNSLFRDDLLLSLIGLRVLTEEYINTVYAFNHPDCSKGLTHTYSVCEDYFTRTNNNSHSKLHNKSLEIRAKEVNLLDPYNMDYRSLSSYIHGMPSGGKLINNLKLSKKYTSEGFVSNIMHAYNISEVIREHFKITQDSDLRDQILSFEDTVDEFIKQLNKEENS